MREDIPGKRLVLPVLPEEKVYDYQVEMIGQNPTPRILPLEKRILNNQIRLYYRTDFQIPLRQYLAGTVLTREKFIDILENVVITLSDCKRYLLYETCFQLGIDYIYINPVTEAVALLYLPVETQAKLAGQIKALINELWEFIPRDDSGDSLVFNKTVYDFQNREVFHIGELAQLTRELRFPRLTDRTAHPGPESKPFELDPEGMGNVDMKENKKSAGNSRIKLIAVMALVQVIFLLILVIFSEKLKLLGNTKVTNTGIALILTAVNIFLINKIFGKTSTANKEAEKRAKEWQNIVTNRLVKENKIIKQIVEKN